MLKMTKATTTTTTSTSVQQKKRSEDKDNNKEGCVTTPNISPTQNEKVVVVENEKNNSSANANEELRKSVAATVTQESVLSAIDDGAPDDGTEIPGAKRNFNINSEDNKFVVQRAPLADDSECNVSSDSEEHQVV